MELSTSAENVNVENEEYEPQVTSSDPEERKLARRLRIKRRIEAIKRQKELEGLEVEPEEVKSVVEKQIETSAEILEQLLVEGEEVVTNVRIGNDSREVNRREKESKRKSEIIDIIKEETEKAEELYDEITRKWDVVAAYKDPLDISDSISLQKDKSDELIKQKDEIIAMLKAEINTAEIKYVQDQETQKEDLATLVKRVDNQVNLMRSSYKKELKMIEEAISIERQMVIDANNKKWESLHKQRNVEEENNMQKKINLADEFMQVFYDIRVEHEEKYRETKIALETENEMLLKELEELKASCLLNGEKLDFNYNILKKREEENLIIRSQQKRLLNKMQDEINTIKRNIKDYKQNSEEKMVKLINEIKKVRNSIFQVEKKADHICVVNDRKYHDVWNLNEEIATSLLEKIKSTDRIIHEQLLGLDWKSPKKTLLKKTKMPSYKQAEKVLEEEAEKEKKRTKTKKFGNTNIDIPVYLMQSIIEKIGYRSGFLLEKALKEILKNRSQLEQNLIKVDNVFETIGIKKPEHFRVIVDLFMPYAHCPICEKSVDKESAVESKILQPIEKSVPRLKSLQKNSDPAIDSSTKSINNLEMLVTSELAGEAPVEVESETKSTSSSSDSIFISEDTDSDVKNIVISEVTPTYTCKNNHPVYVDIANIFKILKSFVIMINEDEVPVTLNERLLRKRLSISRLLPTEEVKSFWDQFNSFFGKHSEEIWNGLFYALKKYHNILEDRHKVYQNIILLRKENFELKHMLKFCSLDPKKKSPRKKNYRKISKSHAHTNM